MAAIYKRELRAYFHSMTGYVFIAFFIAYAGVYFMAYNLNYGYPYFAYVLSGIITMFLIGVPVLTMRCFAEERKNRTDQLLLTSPVKLWKIVAGKYLSMVTILAIPCLIFLIFPWIIKAQGTAYIAVDYLSTLVFFLLGCAYLAMGMFVSTLTESQVLAAVGTFGLLMLQYLWGGLMDFLPTSALSNAVGIVVILTLVVAAIWQMTKNWVICAVLELIVLITCVVVYVVKSSVFESLLTEIMGRLDLSDTLTNIVSGNLLDVSGIILYLSVIAVFLFLTMQMIQKRRWS